MVENPLRHTSISTASSSSVSPRMIYSMILSSLIYRAKLWYEIQTVLLDFGWTIFLNTSCMFLSTWKNVLSTCATHVLLNTFASKNLPVANVGNKIKTKRKRTSGKLENI